MLLAKSCNSEFNIKKSGTLMLGTLHEYRKTEIEQIADRDEGKMTFNLIFEEVVKVDVKWLNAILGGVFRIVSDTPDHNLPMFPGPFSAKITKLRYDHVGNNEIEVRDSSIQIFRSAPNAFIFCMSAVRKMRHCIGMFPEYDDYWYFPRWHVYDFGMGLAQQLLQKIHSERARGVNIVPPEICTETLTVRVSSDLILYVGRDVHIKAGGDLTVENFVSRMYEMAFIKPPSFTKEQEYRFHFTLVSNGKIVEPLVDKLVVDADSLVSLIL